jgi:tripartite-type tricarboxylate transporter receptor subunit TctC
VENVGGAGGTTGSVRAARSTPDGCTILVGQMGTHGTAPALYPRLQYDPVSDFEHVGQISDTPIGVFVRKGLPVSSLQELVSLIRSSPEKLNNGHGDVGSTSHVSCLLFTALIGVRSPVIPYRGSGPALSDLITEKHDFMCDQIPHTVEHARAGSVRALALAQLNRSDALPSVPTTTEAGLPSFQASGWNAMFAPKGTPKAIVERLAAALEAAHSDPATVRRLTEIGAVIPAKRGPDALRAFVAAEVEKWTPVVKAANVRIE